MDWTGLVKTQLPELAPGHHKPGDKRACIMELVSIIEGEEFSDSPKCVDGFIAALARMVNDGVWHAHRNRLLRLGPMMVNSHSSNHLPDDITAQCTTINLIEHNQRMYPDEHTLRVTLAKDLFLPLIETVRREVPKGPGMRHVRFSELGRDPMRELDEMIQRIRHEPRDDIALLHGIRLALSLASADHRYRDTVSFWAISNLEAIIVAGPHTPEPVNLWIKDAERKQRVKQWATDYATA